MTSRKVKLIDVLTGMNRVVLILIVAAIVVVVAYFVFGLLTLLGIVLAFGLVGSLTKAMK